MQLTISFMADGPVDSVNLDVKPKDGRNLPPRRKFAPLDIRLLMYEKALTLRKNSYTLRQIVDAIEREYHYRLCEETISGWTRGITSPHRAGHIFVPKPSRDLAYVIGVETGDAFLNVKLKTYQYRIRLRA